MLHTRRLAPPARARSATGSCPRRAAAASGATAVSLLVDWAFDALELDRIEITTTPDNAAARALAESLGFSAEGVMIGRNLERGRRVDVVLLARLRK